MVTQMEAVALTNDSTVQDARGRLVSADETLRLKEKQFELQLYNRPKSSPPEAKWKPPVPTRPAPMDIFTALLSPAPIN